MLPAQAVANRSCVPVRRIIRFPSQSRRQPTYDDLGVARCPICNAPMTARLTRLGPRFICQCKRAG